MALIVRRGRPHRWESAWLTTMTSASCGSGRDVCGVEVSSGVARSICMPMYCCARCRVQCNQ
jgi:hypothetical protein